MIEERLQCVHKLHQHMDDMVVRMRVVIAIPLEWNRDTSGMTSV